MAKKKNAVTVVVQQKKKKTKKGKNKGIKGSGDYDLATAYRNVGKDLGTAVGFPRVGRALGAGIGAFRGHGDYYPIKANSLVSGGVATRVPKFVNGGRRGVRVIEREFIGVVLSKTTFTNSTYPINPGMSSTFPWLSDVAGMFEEYEFNGLVFEFVSTSAAWNGTTQALGTVIMATDYDSSDTAFATRQQMENSDYACSTAPNVDLMHPCECDVSERPLKLSYVRSTVPPVNSDIKMYDLGKFQIACAGFGTGDQEIGELWVSYDVTLFKKQINPVAPAAMMYNTVSVSAANPAGTAAGRVCWGICDIIPAAGVIQFIGLPLGYWWMLLTYVGSSGSSYTNFPDYTLGSNCTILAMGDSVLEDSSLFGGSINFKGTGTNEVSPCIGLLLNVTGPDPAIVTTTLTLAVPAGTKCQIVLTKFSGGASMPLVYPIV